MLVRRAAPDLSGVLRIVAGVAAQRARGEQARSLSSGGRELRRVLARAARHKGGAPELSLFGHAALTAVAEDAAAASPPSGGARTRCPDAPRPRPRLPRPALLREVIALPDLPSLRAHRARGSRVVAGVAGHMVVHAPAGACIAPRRARWMSEARADLFKHLVTIQPRHA